MSLKTDQQADVKLHRSIVEELAFEPTIDSSQIHVAVRDGIVTLSGNVPNYFDKWSAESTVKRVQGVAGVVEELKVDLFPGMEKTDTDIAEAVRRALEWNVVVAHKQIKFLVEDGWITLEGELEWNYQRQSAFDAVAHLSGVQGVRNLMTLEAHPSSDTILQHLEAAFRRSAELDAHRVHIDLDGGNVTLSGSLPTWAERDAASRAAWSTSGVASVDNKIIVGI
jgi:osmotically-inducible protein OsmY